MALTPEQRTEAAKAARALFAAGDCAGVVARVEPLGRGEWLADPELGVLLALSWRIVGKADEALKLARWLVPVCDRRGRDRLWRQRLNLEGMLLFDRGEVDAAEAVWQGLLEAASRAGDETYVAHANANIAVVATLRADHRRALTCYQRAIAAYTRLGDRTGLAEAHHNLAISYREAGFSREAESHFRRAIEFARAAGREDRIVDSQQESGFTSLLLGDPALARRTTERALRRCEELNDRVGVAEGLRILGIIELSEGARSAAFHHLERALAGARSAGRALLEAETLEALGMLQEAVGKAAVADAHRREAERIFRALGAVRWGERMRATLRAIADGELERLTPARAERAVEDSPDPPSQAGPQGE